MTTATIIDCPHCAVRVQAEDISYIQTDEDVTYILARCPTCKNPLFARSIAYYNENGYRCWDSAERLWPEPTTAYLSHSIPEAARRDIMDAQKCYSHGIYSATAVLCGRAFEHLIKEKVGNFMIAKGIAELKEKEVIDQRLHDWAEALRKERNIGAHASPEQTTKENARDILDFTIAIFDYVYTLSEKFSDYLARKTPPPSEAT